MKEQMSKIIVILLILLIGLGTTSFVIAEELPIEEPKELPDEFKIYSEHVVEWTNIGNETRFLPQILSSAYFIFCANPGGTFKKSTMEEVKTLKEELKSTDDNFSEYHFTGDKYSMEYGISGGEIDFSEHQDAAYVYSAYKWTFAPKEKRQVAGIAMWTTGISDPRDTPGKIENKEAEELARKAAAYKQFYEQIHTEEKVIDPDTQEEVDNNIFPYLVKDNTKKENVKVMVDKISNQYIVGPFNYEFPNGTVSGTYRDLRTNQRVYLDEVYALSYFNGLSILDQDQHLIRGDLRSKDDRQYITDEEGEQVKTLKDVEFIDEKGKLIKVWNLINFNNGDEQVEYWNAIHSGEDFYIRINADALKGVTNIIPRVDLAYYERCYAHAAKYTGYVVKWKWKEGDTVYKENEEGEQVEDYTPYTLEKDEDYKKAQIMAIFNYDGDSYGRVVKSCYVGWNEPPLKIDITMHLAGRVFLDQDQGKINAGNNTYDNGEELEGIDVTLFDSDHNIVATALTDSNGQYIFKGLDAMKKYYVRFGYNGMLYTNVNYIITGANASKAREDEQQHTGERNALNSTFKEIGSYPNNYSIRVSIFPELGKYNKIYYQEEIMDIFKEVAKEIVQNGGNELEAYKTVAGNDLERKRKVQFVADCRINAYTVPQYPRFLQFVISDKAKVVNGVLYQPIYPEQEYVNLGIKNRPTFDLAIYKDVDHAVVKINRKTETYTYDARMDKGGFKVGITESDYLNKMAQAYKKPSANPSINNTQPENAGSYTHEVRSEDIVNGNNSNNQIQENQLFNENKNYVWREIQSGLSGGEKLDIKVTYKIAVRNQSGVEGAVTEIVDYYDPNYDFVSAYLGDQDANKVGNVSHSTTSKYSNSMKDIQGYQKIYFQPDETKLNTANREMYIYATFSLKDPENTLIRAGLLNGNQLETMNLVEINGYTTYDMGLIDIDSIPGNLETPRYRQGNFEDDESTAPSYIYTIRHSRTMEGRVFEDAITSFNDNGKVQTATSRYGNGKLDNKDTKIKDIIVELIEVKDNKMIVRATTRTDSDGWYGFGAFIPGDYVVRFTYGAEDATALTTQTPNKKGSNAISYNGQDYESTVYNTKAGQGTTNSLYTVDSRLQGRYDQNNREKNAQEQSLVVGNQEITQYTNGTYYWYSDKDIQDTSKAKDDEARKNQVIAYSKQEYGREITNHKAEVFNAYANPQPGHIDQTLHNKLIQELERRTYRYAYTAQMPIEVEYTKRKVAGSQPSSQYSYKIEGVNFGIVQRPKAKLEVEKHVSHIRITTADDKVLFDNSRGSSVLDWTVKTNRYRRVPTIQAIMDQELISGSKLEVTYTIKVTNKSEEGIGKTRAKNIIDYVPNNLTFNKDDNPGWEVVNQADIQTDRNSTYINNTQNGAYKLIDLSTKQTIVKTTQDNPLVQPIAPGNSVEGKIVLRKVLSAESPTDDLTYRNMVEIIEIDNEKGRYDHSSIPGNQKPDDEPREDDSYESEIITVLPPFGSRMIYYGLGIVVISLLTVGIYFIKKKVLGNK